MCQGTKITLGNRASFEPHTYYMSFSSNHIHHIKFTNISTNAQTHITLHGTIDLIINLFYGIVKVHVLSFLVFAAMINHRLQSDLYYIAIVSLQLN